MKTLVRFSSRRFQRNKVDAFLDRYVKENMINVLEKKSGVLQIREWGRSTKIRVTHYRIKVRGGVQKGEAFVRCLYAKNLAIVSRDWMPLVIQCCN